MAKASLLLQQAALKEAGIFEALIALQKEELCLQKDSEKQMYEEWKSTSLVLQKIVEKLCPDANPMDCFASRKRKLEELHDVLSEELHELKLQQMKDEFMRAAAM